MAKKLTLLAATVAIVALAAPAVAGAMKLTMPPNSLVVSGKRLITTTTNTQVTTPLGALACSKIETELEVTPKTTARKSRRRQSAKE